MSSRIRNARFPQKDITEIHKIVQYFKNECVRPGEKIGDKSRISFGAFSEKEFVSIDIDAIKHLSDKQSFINSTGKYKNSGLENRLIEFEDRIRLLYAEIVNPGLDLISMLIEKIENDNIVKYDNMIPDGIDTTYIHYDNHIYIFTDGYLEYALLERRRNDQYYFGDSEIKKVRQYCESNDVEVSKALYENRSLRLPPCKSAKNKFINLHILETHERDKNIISQTYDHSRGIRDNEILEAVWREWARESGFKSFTWKKY
jgi:hypothetical protein